MQTKPLLYGLIGFFIGGLLVSIAATTFDKTSTANETRMSTMTSSLQNLQGDAYDEAFIASMIEHHEGAVDMARLSEDKAKHAEIKKLSKDIIAAQEKEISEMKTWQTKWGYESKASNPHFTSH